MGGLLQEITLRGADLPRLEALRDKGRISFAKYGLPTAKTEAWKYTRVRELAADDFMIERTTQCDCSGDCACHDQKVLPFDAYEIRFCNGHLVDSHLHLPAGIEVMTLLEAIAEQETMQYLGKSFNLDDFPFAALNTAYLEQGLFIRMTKSDKPLALIYHTHIQSKQLSNIRNVIVVENGTEAELVEYYHYSGEPKSEYFNNIVNEIYVGRQAHLRHYKKQDESLKSVHIALNSVRVKENGNYESYCLQKGANLARNETHISLKEENAQATANASYVMNGWATLDTTTDIEHLAPNTFSNQLVKGVVGGQAKGVFQGKIHIAPNAVKTQGYQLHKALLLSDNAEVDVKPELEIYADDVKCSHGATSGELDAEQMFYLRSRGIDEQSARHILIEAFAEEAFANIENQDVKNWLTDF